MIEAAFAGPARAGVAVSAVSGVGLFLATVVLLLQVAPWLVPPYLCWHTISSDMR